MSLLEFESRDDCPACGGRSETVYRCPFNTPPISTFINDYYREQLSLSGEYRIERCLDCKTMFQAEVGGPDLLTNLYSVWIKAMEPEEDAAFQFDMTHPELSRDGHEIMAAAAHLGMPITELVTLDYGAGWAGWARVAKQLGCQSHSFDYATDRQAMAERFGITADTGRYHFINTEQVMEHVVDPAGLVSELVAKLLPGGILKISVPSNRGVEATLARLRAGQQSLTHDEIMPILPLEHVNCFTKDGLRSLGNQNGLREVKPSYLQRFAFLRHEGAIQPRHAMKLAKELVRPFWQWRNPSNLYIWLQAA